MFILRIIDKANVERNIALGDNYNFIARHTNYESFSEKYFETYGESHRADNDEKATMLSRSIFAFIEAPKINVTPMNKEFKYYIMTESGKTFDNLTFK